MNVTIDHRAENSPLALTLDARATRFEAFRFHGFGNDAPEVENSLSRVDQDLVSIKPMLAWQIGWRAREVFGQGVSNEQRALPGLRPVVGRLEAGPVILWNQPEPRDDAPLADPAISGRDGFGRAGLRLGLSLDQTSSGSVSDKGWRFLTEIVGYPPIWDVERSFGTAAATLATYLPLPGPGTHLAFRAGGEVGSGAFPVQHAPAIGGRRTVRGYGYHRFRGESSAYGSAELRVPAGKIPLLIRWDAGVFALADAGRVWFDGRSPGGWHAGYGGGIWFSALGQAFSVAYANGDGHRFYLQRGLSF